MSDAMAAKQAALAKQHSYDISNEAWREYDYGDGRKVRFDGGKTLILDKRPDGDRHRIIVVGADGKEVGAYVAPGWLAIRWQTPDGKHGITF
jgi:hypothetical protein